MGSSVTATVDWNPQFSGAALISVHGYNDCGPGQESEILEVTVIAAPQPEITGLTEVCSNVTGVLYSTPENTGNTYYWEIAGGEITSGAGTSEVMVSWGMPGNGTLSVTESSSDGCTDTAMVEVTIYDCTGLGEGERWRLELYPNPVTDRLILKSNHQEGGTYDIRVINQSGQVVYQENADVGQGSLNTTISTAHFPGGVYTVQVRTAGGSQMESKFMKIR
jgi:hypothetical protein